MEGNLNKTQIPTDQNQPIDNAKVKNPMKILPPRPTLSESTHLEAAKQLDEHNKETNKQIEDDKIKLQKQQNITGTEREKKIIELFNRQACKVGIAPISKKHVLAVCESMTKKGILKRSEDHDTRVQRTIKSLVKTWTKKNLQIKEDDWNNIKVTEI